MSSIQLATDSFGPNDDNNILSCGYLRNYEHNNDVTIADCVASIIGTYCKYYMVWSNDPVHNSSQWNRLSTMNSLTSNIHNMYAKGHGVNIQSIFNNKTTINAISISSNITATDSKRIFVSTTDNKLYKYKLNTNKTSNPKYMLEHIDTDFLETSDSIIDIQSGLNHTLLLSKLGNVYSFGCNDVGQCGHDTKQFKFISKPKLMSTNIIAIACGTQHSLLLNNKHSLLVCGSNYNGQCGISESKSDSDFEFENTNHYDSDMDEYAEISDNSMGFDMIDSSDDEYDIIDESEENNIINNLMIVDTPTVNEYFVENNIKINKIYAGQFHSLCIGTNGKCYTFGLNAFGQLGNGKCADFSKVNVEPQEICIENEFIIDGSCGDNHNMLLTKNNNIICFGDNSSNQCSVIKKNKIISPYIISKKNELGVHSDCYIEKVICLNNKSLMIIDEYKRYKNRAI